MKQHPVQPAFPETPGPIIKVIGVGGGGGNAINYMHCLGIKGVSFAVCNTDRQDLNKSPVGDKIQLGANLTRGLGAGNNPEMGRKAALESVDDIKRIFNGDTRMAFITAGMGGGTGTGAAPIIAGIAKENGILTVGIVTIPFGFEGPARRNQAYKGVVELQKNVDTLLVICNDKIRLIYGDLDVDEGFGRADDVLGTAAKGIAEIITVPGKINVDFEDVRTVMTNGGVAIMGSAESDGENRARSAVEKALASPLLNDNKINGANHLLLNITYGQKKATLDEVTEITEYLQNETGKLTNLIWGLAFDETLGEKIKVTIIATGYPSHTDNLFNEMAQMEKRVKPLGNTQLFINPQDQGKTGQSTGTRPGAPSGPQGNSGREGSQQKPAVITLKKTTPAENLKGAQSTLNLNFTKQTAGDPAAPAVQHEPGAKSGRMKDITLRMRSSSGLNDLEKVPAYIRRNVKLDQTSHSSESEISRFTLSVNEDETGKKIPEIKPGNSFLHDNVD